MPGKKSLDLPQVLFCQLDIPGMDHAVCPVWPSFYLEGRSSELFKNVYLSISDGEEKRML